MARIQILELPMVHVGDATETPFLLVIDQVETGPNGERFMNPSDLEGACERIGARHILIFEDTIHIPANQPSPTPNTEQGIPPGSTYQMVIDGKPIVWEPAQPGREQESTGRPTHPDGTPYNYSKITAEGWEHCDGCRTWGQWTAEDPHDCPSTFVKGPAADG